MLWCYYKTCPGQKSEENIILAHREVVAYWVLIFLLLWMILMLIWSLELGKILLTGHAM